MGITKLANLKDYLQYSKLDSFVYWQGAGGCSGDGETLGKGVEVKLES